MVQVFQGLGFSGCRLFRVQVFQGPGFSWPRLLRIQVQVLEVGVLNSWNFLNKEAANGGPLKNVLKNFKRVTRKHLRWRLLLLKLKRYPRNNDLEKPCGLMLQIALRVVQNNKKADGSCKQNS